MTSSISGKSAARTAARVRSWMSIVQSGTSGACIAMSRAISSWRSMVRIRPTIVALRVARARARWNLRSSCRKRSSWLRKSSLAASSRWRSIVRAIAAKSSSVAWTAASWATRGSSRRRASSTPAISPKRISWRLRSSSRGISSDATKIPPDCPRRTSSTPASVSALIASRRVGRLHGARDPLLLAPPLVAVPLARYVDQPAAVGQEVGYVEDPALHQRPRDLAARERIVRGARHHVDVAGARERVVDQPAGGARGEHVELEPEDRLGGRRDLGAVLGGELPAAAVVEVARHHAGAGVNQAGGQPAADLAEAHHPHAPAVEFARAVVRLEPALDRLEHGLGRHGGGVAPAAVLARTPDAEAREAGHVVHVGAGRADVLGRDVGPVQRLYGARRPLQAGAAHLGAPVVDHY